MSDCVRRWSLSVLLGIAVLGAGLTLGGCGGGGGATWPTTVTFTASPLALGDIAYIQPLGNLNPPGHTFPSDHIGFYFADPSRSYPVVAPANGTLTGVLRRASSIAAGYDCKLEMRHTATVRSYLDHVGPLDPALLAQIGPLTDGFKVVNVPVTAGQRLGWSGGPPGDLKGMDLGVVNTARSLPGFVHPEKYHDTARYADAPLSYYEAPLREALYALVACDGPNKDGKIDLDVPGRLVGNWFSQGAGADDWARHLAFVFEPQHPAQVRIAMGGELGLTGVYAIPDAAPRPADVSQATGKVAYRLYYPHTEPGGPAVGLLLVQLTAADTIRVELFPGSQALDAEFTAASYLYTR